jgi:biopolymer transport protein ExbD
MKGKQRNKAEVDSSSMADIAFLLLIFFLVTTTIASDKGIPMVLPPKSEDQVDFKLKEKNIFKVLINSKDQLLVEGEPLEFSAIRETCTKFLNNRGKDPSSSDSPKDAVVSIKADRGTSYEKYLTVLDEVTAAYNQSRAQYLGISLEDYNKLDMKNPNQKQAYDAARREFPLQISEAEPTDIDG